MKTTGLAQITNKLEYPKIFNVGNNIVSKLGILVSSVLIASLATPLSANAASLFGNNLIVNGDAETGTGSTTGNTIETVPSWTTTGNFTVVKYSVGGGFPLPTDPGPQNQGQQFFAGGPSNSSSSATQLIDISTAQSDIDTGNVKYALSGYFGGFDGQNDYSTLTAKFINDSNEVLKTISLGSVSALERRSKTGLLLRDTSGTVPIGTKNISLLLLATRTDGSYNDGYADNLNLTLSSNAVPEPSFMLSTLVAGVLGTSLKMKRKQKLTLTK